MSIYKDCDIRGVYGRDLTEAEMRDIGRAVGTQLAGRTIVVGGDFRTHTPALKAALLEGLLECGAQVTDVGQLSTPQLYFSKRYLDSYASAQVTASHNPAQYNGLKLMFGKEPTGPEQMRALEQRVHTKAFTVAQGSCRQVSTDAAYFAMLTRGFPSIRPLKVVIDAGNGAMSEAAPRVMRALGLEVVPLFCTYDGTFPNRDPNPAVRAHLTVLCKTVVDAGADFGVAFDGDGDRAVFVDAAGEILSAEESMVIFIRHLLKPGESVVYDLKCSSILARAVKDCGGTAYMERSGHGFIRQHFLQIGSVLAGEVSGHFFFRELGGDDGLYALVRMAEILGTSQNSLRDLLAGVQYTAITPDIRVPAAPEEIARVFDAMERWAAAQHADISRLDGVRAQLRDGSWVLLRRSITEPAYTLRLEAADEAALAALKQQVAAALAISI